MVFSAYQTERSELCPAPDTDFATHSRADDLAAFLRRLIQSGDPGPGDRLPSERELALTLGVARPTLRHALKILQEEGYLVTRRGAAGGSFVRELDRPADVWFTRMRLDRTELEDLIDYREGVETQIARLAALRRDREDLDELARWVDALAHVTTRGAFRQADAGFHGALARAGRNVRLERALSAARGEFFLPTDRLLGREQIDDTRNDHRDILDAVAARLPDQAARAVSTHMSSVRRHLALAIDTPPPQQGTVE